MGRESDINALRFTETTPPLALAPLAGLAVLACGSLPQTGLANVLIVALYMAPFCYGAAALFVLPVLARWPPLRRPSYPVAAILGNLIGLVCWHAGHVGPILRIGSLGAVTRVRCGRGGISFFLGSDRDAPS